MWPVLPVQSASSSGEGHSLLLLNWIPQLEAARLSGLSRQRQLKPHLSVDTRLCTKGVQLRPLQQVCRDSRVWLSQRALKASCVQHLTYISPLELQAWKRMEQE